MAIHFFSEEISFNLKQVRLVRSWLLSVVHVAGKTCGDLNYIFCSDEYLLEMNRRHLQHDYYTDIITFDYCTENQISGDLYISIDRVRDNAKENSVATSTELHRVMVHGLLHLLGHADSTPAQKSAMRAMEDKCLSLLKA